MVWLNWGILKRHDVLAEVGCSIAEPGDHTSVAGGPFAGSADFLAFGDPGGRKVRGGVRQLVGILGTVERRRKSCAEGFALLLITHHALPAEASLAVT